MTSLSDQIDRLSQCACSIKDTTLGALKNNNPFTAAVLTTELGDLIRDVDPSELGLFNLVPSSDAEIKRVQFTGSTPLRKATRRDDKPPEIDPEVYAQAALKCIDQYQSVRSMPRARSQVSAILDRLSLVRGNIVALNVTLQQIRVTDTPSIKAQIIEQDHKVKQLQTRMNELSKRKKHAAMPRQHAVSGQTTKPATVELENDDSSSSPHEDRYNHTPAEASRILRFSDDLLMDEQVDFGDTSSASFVSALPEASIRDDMPADPLELSTVPVTGTLSVDESLRSNNVETAVSPTMLTSHVSSAPSPLKTQNTNPSDKPYKSGRIRVNTEVERIVSKIWITVGDIIMPGSSFPPDSPPSAKDTILHLQELCNLPPQLDSPGTSSVSTLSTPQTHSPSLQQILTAYLLVSLLSAPPQYSMPLNKVKDSLAAKAKSGGISVGMLGQGTSRVLYGCVAKRLVKVERGGGEQTVKFDI